MMKSANRRLVVVVGMHRSGTSALTRSLQVLGIDLGQNLLPVAGDNEKGFWEDADIYALNVRILQSLESDWHHLKRVHERDVQDLKDRGFVLEAAELLRSKLADVEIFGFKDPRVALLLPFWKEVFSYCELQVDYLFAIRHPLSVAKSLQKRDGIDVEKSYLLWLNHVITSLEHGAAHGGIIVDYDHFIKSPDREIERLAVHLGLEIDSIALREFRSEFLDADLRHTVYEAEALTLDPSCPPLVREVYDVLLAIAVGEASLDAKALAKKAGEWSAVLGRLEPIFPLIDRLYATNAALSRAVAERDAALITRDSELEHLRQSLASREASLAAILTSSSWRITSPLRRAAESRPFKSVRRLLTGASRELR